jgi:hypothetical protein
MVIRDRSREITPLSSSWAKARATSSHDGGVQVASQPLGHGPEGQVADDPREVTDPAGQGLEHRNRHRWASLTETKHLGAREE